jgi:branched-chain amino acid transport system ATP-binding protein
MFHSLANPSRKICLHCRNSSSRNPIERQHSVAVQSCEEAETAMLLCEQNLWFARKCTSYVYVMESGRVVFEGDWNEFDAHPDVKTKYLAV